MAWNPSPEVAAARDIGKRFNKDIVIVLHIDGEGRVGYYSYGKTVQLCKVAKVFADEALEAVSGRIEETDRLLPRTQPKEQPR
jgi:hypothetical protein